MTQLATLNGVECRANSVAKRKKGGNLAGQYLQWHMVQDLMKLLSLELKSILWPSGKDDIKTALYDSTLYSQ